MDTHVRTRECTSQQHPQEQNAVKRQKACQRGAGWMSQGLARPWNIMRLIKRLGEFQVC